MKTNTQKINPCLIKRLEAFKHSKINKGYGRILPFKKSTLIRCDNGSEWYCDSLENCDPFELVDDASKIVQMNYSGWYTDNFKDNILIPCIVSLRTSGLIDDGGTHKQYYPASKHSEWDGAIIYNERFYNPEDAALCADRIAEREAEKLREHDAQNKAECDIEDLKQELHDLNRETLQLIRDSRHILVPDSICGLIRSSIQSAIARRAQIFKRIEALNDNYWLSVE